MPYLSILYLCFSGGADRSACYPGPCYADRTLSVIPQPVAGERPIQKGTIQTRKPLPPSPANLCISLWVVVSAFFSADAKVINQRCSRAMSCSGKR